MVGLVDVATAVREWAIPVLTLLLVCLTYLRTRRMRPDQIERQIRERFQSTVSYEDFKMGLGTVTVSADNSSLRKRLENLYRKYPHGTTRVDVTFADTRRFRQASMDDDVFDDFCEELDIEAEQVKVETRQHSQESLIVDIKTTDPDDAYRFLRYLPMVVSGEWSFS